MYSIIDLHIPGTARIGFMARRALMSSRAAVASSVHLNVLVCFHILYKGSAFSPSHDMKRLKYATQLANFCTCLSSIGTSIRSKARISAGLASIPQQDTMKLRNLLAGTLKLHFSRLSLICNSRKLANVSRRLSTNCLTCLVLTTTLST